MAEWSDRIWDSLDKTLREFDASILTLSSATLVLSATFIDKLGAESPHLVASAWTLLLWAVGLTLAGRLVSALVHALLTPGALLDQPISDQSAHRWSLLIWLLTIASLVTFVLGLVRLIAFANANLGG